MRSRRSLSLLLVIAAVACGYRHSRPVVESGRDFPCRSAIGLEGEPSPSEVIAMIGEPLERRPVEGGEVFRYWVRGKYGDHVKLFGIVTVSEPHDYWSCDVRLKFRSGHLYSITYTRVRATVPTVKKRTVRARRSSARRSRRDETAAAAVARRLSRRYSASTL